MLSYDDFQSVFGSGTFAQHYGFTRDHAKELATKGSELLDAGAAEEAVAIFQGLVVMNHKDPGNWVSLGIAYAEAQRAGDARSALETALRLHAGHPVATKYLARLQER